MSIYLHDAVVPTCAAVTAVLDDLPGGPGAPDVDLTAPTPCTDLDLRALVEHFVGTSGAMARLGAGEPLDPAEPWGGGRGAADGDWAGRLRANLDAVGRGWSRPDPWEGEGEVGGAPLPSTMLGEMALVEVAVARLGRRPRAGPDARAGAHRRRRGRPGRRRLGRARSPDGRLRA